MKILGIAGSPRKGGNTEIAIEETLAVCKSLGATTEFVTLADLRVRDCTNCGICPKSDCPIQDDVRPVIDKMLVANAIIIGSPVYFGDVSGLLKCLLDRTVILKRRGNLLKDKVGACIAVGKIWGHSRALETLAHFFCAHSMIIASVPVYPGIGLQLLATKKGELQDKKELASVRDLAERVYSLTEKVLTR